jgi:hypothetical protein
MFTNHAILLNTISAALPLISERNPLPTHLFLEHIFINRFGGINALLMFATGGRREATQSESKLPSMLS